MDYQIKQMIGDEKTHRYVLASRCAKPLVVIGVNPSTANEKYPDPTVRKVMGFAELNNYDGFVMLNLYAQRSTNFKGVHNKRDIKNLNIGDYEEDPICCIFANAFCSLIRTKGSNEILRHSCRWE